jgi:hypothetical protein
MAGASLCDTGRRDALVPRGALRVAATWPCAAADAHIAKVRVAGNVRLTWERHRGGGALFDYKELRCDGPAPLRRDSSRHYG